MSDRHLVVGAGPVGREVVRALAERGAEVVLASRSGAGPDVPGATRLALDATDPDALGRAAAGAVALYNCVNPPEYHRWPELWPPLARALLLAAERTGAVLATAGNLYPYGPLEDGRMTEDLPDAARDTKGRVRATMTAEALAAHREGRLRAVEVRGSDYVGAGPGDYAHVPRVVPAALAGCTAWVVGSPDQPHTWTDVRDMGRALALVATEPTAWGRVWHAPSAAPRTQREAIGDVCASVGATPGAVRAIPGWALRGLGLASPTVRAIAEMDHQFRRPFVMDSSAITAAYGLAPTDWAETCRRTAA